MPEFTRHDVGTTRGRRRSGVKGLGSMPLALVLDHLGHGAVALGMFVALFLAARFRFTAKERDGGPADIGLD